MKTKKDLEERIEELEELVKQKDILINLINIQYQNNIPDVKLGCDHDWKYSDGFNSTAAPSRVCSKCGIWESIPYYNNGFPNISMGNQYAIGISANDIIGAINTSRNN